MPWTGLAIGAGLGLLKSETVDKDREERQRRLAAETQRYSPWTGLQAGPIQESDMLGNMLQYGGTGASMQQGVEQAAIDNELKKKYGNWLDQGPLVEQRKMQDMNTQLRGNFRRATSGYRN